MFFKLSNLNSNLALTLGYLNSALNNSALNIQFRLRRFQSADAATERQNENVSWRRRVQIKQLAWSMAERQIGHRKSCLVLSSRFPDLNWRSRHGTQ